MSADTNCIYRIVESKKDLPNSTSPFQIPEEACPSCQILQSYGAKDTICYNTDQGEETCSISPLNKR